MNTEKNLNKRNGLYLAMVAAATLMLSACDDDNDSNNNATVIDEPTNTAVTVAKPSMPEGLGYEHYVATPDVNDPLPGVTYMSRNNGDGRYYRDSNPINTVLKGMNNIWQRTNDDWQTTAGDRKRDIDGYKAGDGPDPVRDVVTAGTEIKDAGTWKANMDYVVQVTQNRTAEQAYYAFLDDRRSKTYGTIDGFGPLTEDYAANSGAYASFHPINLTDVTENNRYVPAHNDSYSTYGGKLDSELGDMVALAKLFRDSFASTEGPKYVFNTPRPWRMNANGEEVFQSVETLNCEDGSTVDRQVKEYRIDRYDSPVSVVPGLFCVRRPHSSGNENLGIEAVDKPNYRKDGAYPSGHTNAGMLASLAYAYMLPERFAEHMARGSDLGENRIIAGMHSPVDVIGGRIQALMVATYALNEHPDIARKAFDKARTYFGSKADAAGMSLYDYTHQTVANPGSFANTDGTLNVNVFNNNRFADQDAIRYTYQFRLTYGLPQTGTKGIATVVPQGAEALLETRQPYLNAEQRRAVLASTAVDSGYPLLDETNGWGRLNLVAAADGYGAFAADVNVFMEAGKGGFNAKDWWRNNISGPGKLTKSGSGELVMMGTNSYSGGTVLENGTLTAASAAAFGTGTVFVQDGELAVDAAGALAVTALNLEPAASLSVAMDEDSSQIAVTGTAYIEGASLELNFTQAPAAGSTFTILTAKNIGGEFASVYAGNHNVTLEYTATSVIARLN